tara:strand:+ start:1246 stop:3459 length:2214 start_codon:yes stop_codon:yes gene_type:complete
MVMKIIGVVFGGVLLLVIVIGIFYFTTQIAVELEGYPKSASYDTRYGTDGFDVVVPIDNFFGDYLIEMDAKMTVSSQAGRGYGGAGHSSSISMGFSKCGVDIDVSENPHCYKNCGTSCCISSKRKSEHHNLKIITNTKDRTIKCNVDDKGWSEPRDFGTTNVLKFYTTRSGGASEAHGFATGSITINYIKIEDLQQTSFVNYNIYDTFDKVETVCNTQVITELPVECNPVAVQCPGEPTAVCPVGTYDGRKNVCITKDRTICREGSEQGEQSKWKLESGQAKIFLGKLLLDGKIKLVENMKNRIVRIEFDATQDSTLSIFANNNLVTKKAIADGEVGSIEIKSSPLNPNKMNYFINGVHIKQEDYNDVSEVFISMTGDGLRIDNAGFRTLFETCKLGKNQFLAYETFTGSQTISHFSTRKTIQQYCVNLPPILKKGKGIEEVPELLTTLSHGGTYNIVEGDTIILPYIYTKTDVETLPCIPKEGELINFNTNTCEDISGVTFFCSEGVWNDEKHTCDIYPELKPICDIGVLDGDKCIWHPPEQAVCENPRAVPERQSTFDKVSSKCIWFPDTEAQCEDFETYNPERKVCESFPLKEIECPISTAYDAVKDRCVGTVDIITSQTLCVQKPDRYWDSNKQKCIEEFDLVSAQEACEMDDGVWKGRIQQCIQTAPVMLVCEDDTEPQMVNGRKVCVDGVKPTIQPFIERRGFNYLPWIVGIVIGIVVGLLVVITYVRFRK